MHDTCAHLQRRARTVNQHDSRRNDLLYRKGDKRAATVTHRDPSFDDRHLHIARQAEWIDLVLGRVKRRRPWNQQVTRAIGRADELILVTYRDVSLPLRTDEHECVVDPVRRQHPAVHHDDRTLYLRPTRIRLACTATVRAALCLEVTIAPRRVCLLIVGTASRVSEI